MPICEKCSKKFSTKKLLEKHSISCNISKKQIFTEKLDKIIERIQNYCEVYIAEALKLERKNIINIANFDEEQPKYENITCDNIVIDSEVLDDI